MSLAKKRHQKQLRRNAKKQAMRKSAHMKTIRAKEEERKKNTIEGLYTSMLDNIEPENFDEWVKKLDIKDEYREELEVLVAEELKRRSNTDEVGNFSFGEETPTDDEPVEEPKDTGNFTFGS